MTKEITSLSAKELRRLKEATEVLGKVYGLKPEDIDNALKAVRFYPELLQILKRMDATMKALSSAVQMKMDSENERKLQAYMDDMNREAVMLDLSNV